MLDLLSSRAVIPTKGACFQWAWSGTARNSLCHGNARVFGSKETKSETGNGAFIPEKLRPDANNIIQPRDVSAHQKSCA